MLRLLKSLCLIFVILALFPTIILAENITITTYYPSPNGAYNNLTVYNNLSAGNVTAVNFGYTTGSCGAVTQLTSKSTGVTLNSACGTITMFATPQMLSEAVVNLTVTNNRVSANDTIVTQHNLVGAIGSYTITENTLTAGTFRITVKNISTSTLSDAIQIRFAVIKG
jgi:hypothetical protein